jgi:hypothetical protein
MGDCQQAMSSTQVVQASQCVGLWDAVSVLVNYTASSSILEQSCYFPLAS